MQAIRLRSIESPKGGSVWGTFALSDESFDTLDYEEAPMYRIDDYAPVDLNDMKDLQELEVRLGAGSPAYQWEPQWVSFVIWHGQQKKAIAQDLIQLMKGDRVVFRNYLSTGGYKETAFTLDGAASAISKAIGISENVAALERQEVAVAREHRALTEQWSNAIVAKIQRLWRKPTTTSVGQSCKVRVIQTPDGEVVTVEVWRCTGGEIFRRSVKAAVWKADPLPQAPTFDVFESVIEFTFAPGG